MRHSSSLNVDSCTPPGEQEVIAIETAPEPTVQTFEKLHLGCGWGVGGKRIKKAGGRGGGGGVQGVRTRRPQKRGNGIPRR